MVIFAKREQVRLKFLAQINSTYFYRLWCSSCYRHCEQGALWVSIVQQKQKRKVFGFHSIQATFVRCLLFCHLFRKCIEKFSYLFSVGCILFFVHSSATIVCAAASEIVLEIFIFVLRGLFVEIVQCSPCSQKLKHLFSFSSHC